MNVYLGGKKLSLDPALAIGKGGEADVYDIGGARALKLFKPPTHPDLAGEPEAQRAAQERIEEHQRKLRQFPGHLPARVICPERLATTRDGGQVLGYTMRLLYGAEPLLRYSDRTFRQNGVPGDLLISIFRDLRASVVGLHAAGVVIGDFNDLNVLVLDAKAHLIDADSFQFGPFLCRVFCERFVDPLLCDAAAARPQLARPHNAESDWYAYNVMLMRSLLFVDPYGGVFKPKASSVRIPPGARPLHRITVFHPEVRYPKPALRQDVLPDDLLHHLHRVFEKDQRGEFPVRLLDDLRFTHCQECGLEHARSLCPACHGVAPAAVREATTVRGDVVCTRVLRTRGEILFATTESGCLKLLVQENGSVRREDGSVVLAGAPQAGMRYAISGSRTLVARGSRLAVLAHGREPTLLGVDVAGTEPAFAANERRLFWIEAGRLMREGSLGTERIGDVLPRQTRFWVGPAFGFGFYRAGELFVSFVFEAEGHQLNDGAKLPPLQGQLVEARAVFGQDVCWFLTVSRDRGRTRNRCVLLRRDGSVEAATEADQGDGSWLREIEGCCAAGAFLLAPTDEGLVRVEAQGGQITTTREYPDTEPFVSAGCRLLAGHDGVYVVDRQEIRRLRIG
jgi:hypothetical protein